MMNNTGFIHPLFTLCGIRYDGDFTYFSHQVLTLYKDNDELHTYALQICDFIKEWINDSPYVICHTSGSTGTPKDILLPKITMINSAHTTGEFFCLKEKSLALLCLPMAYIAARMMVVRAMTLGWDLDIESPHMTHIETLDKLYDFIAVVPFQLYKNIEYIGRYKNILVGGAAINDAFIKKLHELNIHAHIYHSYGMTETASHVALRMLYPTLEDTYHAVSNVTFSTNEDCSLVIDAPYLHHSSIVTNDIVKLEDSRHFIWIGRRDFVINSGGIKIHPEVTEKILSDVICGRFFVYGEKDPILGEKQVLIIEGEDGSYPTLDDFIEKHFDRIHRPKTIYYIKRFVLTDTGKINRHSTFDLLKSSI